MDIKFYYCYSVELRNFLKEKGFKYLMCAIHPNTKNMFWLYLRDDKLTNVLDEWFSVER